MYLHNHKQEKNVIELYHFTTGFVFHKSFSYICIMGTIDKYPNLIKACDIVISLDIETDKDMETKQWIFHLHIK